MRTTLNVDDDVLEIAKLTAYARKISVGEALSELARKGINTSVGTRLNPDSGLRVFDVPSVPKLTSEDVYRVMAEEDLEKYLDLQRTLMPSKNAQSVVAKDQRKAVNDKP